MKLNFQGLFDSDREFLKEVGFTNVEVSSADLPDGWHLHNVGHDAVLMDPQDRVRADLIRRDHGWVLIPKIAFKIRENTKGDACEILDMRRYGGRTVILGINPRANAEKYLDHVFPEWKNPVSGWWHESD